MIEKENYRNNAEMPEQYPVEQRNLFRKATYMYLKTLFSQSADWGDAAQLAMRVAKRLCDLVEADGLCIVSPGEVTNFGVTVDGGSSGRLAQKLLFGSHNQMVSAICVEDFGIHSSKCAFALALPVNTDGIIFFREESKTWSQTNLAAANAIRDALVEVRIKHNVNQHKLSLANGSRYKLHTHLHKYQNQLHRTILNPENWIAG